MCAVLARRSSLALWAGPSARRWRQPWRRPWLPLWLPLWLLGMLVGLGSAQAANPYLQAPDDQPVSVELQGSEWGDDIDGGERPLRARLTTTRVAVLPYGSVYRLEFVSLPAPSAMPRAIAPLLLLATESELVSLASEDWPTTLARLQAQPQAPPSAASDLRAIDRGRRLLRGERGAQEELRVVGSRCTYRYRHPSGHFTTLVFQRGLGLIEYAQGRGARADGFRLQRAPRPAEKKPGR